MPIWPSAKKMVDFSDSQPREFNRDSGKSTNSESNKRVTLQPIGTNLKQAPVIETGAKLPKYGRK